MCLVNHQHCPLDRAEAGDVDADQFVGREQHVELEIVGPHAASSASTVGAFVKRKLVLAYHCARVFVADVRDAVKVWRPGLELSLPVYDC